MATAPVTLPLSDICNVIVQIAPISPAQPTFNQGLILGPSSHIADNASDRVRMYTALSQLAADGFLLTDPEYIAASLYFSQSPPPQTLWVGRQNIVTESLLQAIQACQNKSSAWWAFMAVAPGGAQVAKADHEALANFALSSAPPTCYLYTTDDSDVPTGTAGNIFDFLEGQSNKRALGMYSTTQQGNQSNNVYAAAALMGVAMGLNSGLANSNFTLKFKQLAGINPEPLTETQVNSIKGENGNVYVSRGGAFNFFEEGTLANGQFFDEVLGLDMLASAIQYAVMNLLADNPSIPLTDAGETQLIHAVNEACEAARIRGFIAPGVWTGPQVLGLNTEDPLPRGYLAQAAPFSTQAKADHSARKAMPIYVTIIEAGSAHSLLVGVYVQR